MMTLSSERRPNDVLQFRTAYKEGSKPNNSKLLSGWSFRERKPQKNDFYNTRIANAIAKKVHSKPDILAYCLAEL